MNLLIKLALTIGVVVSTLGTLKAQDASAPPPHVQTSGWVVQAASGGTIAYDNGNTDPLTDSGNEMSSWVQADDFELAVDTEITGASVDWFDLGFGNGWDGGIAWFILSDAAGAPGGVVATGAGNVVSNAHLSNAQGRNWFTTCFDLDVPVTLTGGTRYWFALLWSGDQTYERDYVYLAYSVNQAFNFSLESQRGLFNNWTVVTSEDRAFVLFGDACDQPATATFRNDSGNTNTAGYFAGSPIQGSVWVGTVDNSITGNSMAGILGFYTPVEVFQPYFNDYLLIDTMDPGGELLSLSALGGSGIVTFTKNITSDPTLCGLRFSTQAVGFGGGVPVTLHNAYDMVLGF